MWTKLLTWASPHMLWLKIAFCAALLLGGFYAGIKTQRTLDKAANTNAYEKVIEGLTKQASSDKLLIKKHQDNEAALNETYTKLEKELRNAKGKLASCKSGGNVVISDTARGLWNNISAGESLSEDTPRASDETSSTSTVVKDIPALEITIEDLYDNYNKNAEICNGFRLQIEKIIEWDKALDDNS